MKKSVNTRILAFCLSVALILGNVIPVYATEVEGENPEIIQMEENLSEEDVITEDSNNLEGNILTEDVVQVGASSSNTIIENDRPSLSYKYDENGLAEALIVDCSEADGVEEVWIDLYSEEEIFDRVKEIEVEPGDIVEIPFEEFRFNNIGNYQEIRAHFFPGGNEVVGPYAALDEYRYIVTSNAYDGDDVSVTIEKAVEEDSEYIYIPAEELPENAQITGVCYMSSDPTDENTGYTTASSDFRLDEDGINWVLKCENQVDVVMLELTYRTINVEEGQVNVNYYVVSDEQLVTDDGNDPDLGGDEATLVTPSAELMMDDLDDPVIRLTNNASETCNLYYGWMKRGDELSDISVNCEWYIDSDDYINVPLESFKDYGCETPGEYYLVVYAENEDGLTSEAYMLEDYPFVVEDNGVMENELTLATGNISGKIYIEGFEIPGEVSGYAEVLATYGDGTTETTTMELASYYEVPVFHKESFSYFEEYCESWEILNIHFNVIQAAPAQFILTRVVAQEFTEGIRYEEELDDPDAPGEDTTLEAPSLGLAYDEDDNVTGILLTNNSDIDFCYDILTREEIESNAQLKNSSWFYDTSIEIPFRDIIDYNNYDPGTYYFVAYTERYGTLSERVVLEDYPIVISKETLDETITYHTGDVSGVEFYTDYPTTGFNYMRHIIECGEGEDAWTMTSSVEDDREFFWFNKEEYDDWYFAWSFKGLLYGEINASEEGCTITETTFLNVEKGEDYEEPQAPAPTVSLHTDENGVVDGVNITNNLTHDYGRTWIRLELGEHTYYLEYYSNLDPGETVTYFFKDLDIMFDDFEEFKDITGKLYCYTYDDDTGLRSKNVYLDIPVSVEQTNYEGDTITLRTEFGEEDGEKVCWMYVDADKLPANQNVYYVNYGMTWDDGDSYEASDVLRLTDDGTQRLASCYGNIDSTKISSIKCETVASSESAIKIQYTVVSGDKLVVEKADLSRKPVILLDYDYYNAFIASGGTVTVKDGDLVMSTDKFTTSVKWTLNYLQQWFEGTGLYRFVKNITKAVKSDANKYWTCEVGEFQPVNYYNTDGKVIAEESLSKQDIVLIKYEPEIVWVDSMELKAPKIMEFDQTAKVTAILDAGQDKYPFERTPQVRFESSNSDILAVDAATGELTAGTEAGTVTITAYADEDLRIEEGLDEIVTASVTINVEPKHEHNYVFTTEKKATFDEDGKRIGVCACEASTVEEVIYQVAPVELGQTSYTYDGTIKKPAVTVKDTQGTALVEGTDYTVAYKNNKNAGTAAVTVTLKGNYAGTATKNFDIVAKDINACTASFTKKFAYTGKAIAPTVTVKNGSVTLVKGTDYTVAYSANIKPGKAIVTITGKGNYSGLIEKSFVIVPKKATLSSVTASTTVAGRLTVKWTKDSLADGYMLQYSTSSSFTASTTKTLTIDGNATVSKTLSGLTQGKTYYVRVASYVTVDKTAYNGAYSTSLNAKTKKNFTVNTISNKAYTGSAINPTVTVKNGSTTLKKDTDYTVAYKNNKYPGLATVTVKGKGNYAGTVTTTFVIVPKKAAVKTTTSTGVGKLKVTWTKDAYANGYRLQYSTSSTFASGKTQTVIIKGNATLSKVLSNLTEGTTYYVRVASYVTVNGQNYYGTYSVKQSAKVRSSFTVNAIGNKTYTGKALVPVITVKCGSKILKKGTDYNVTYSNNLNPGLAKVKVTGIGNYAGTVNTTFKIVPKKATLSSVSSAAVGKLTAKWVKDAKADGYIVQYSTSSNFAAAATETIEINSYTKLSTTVNNLTSKTKYFVRVAAFTTIDDAVYRGSYSAVKSIIVK